MKVGVIDYGAGNLFSVVNAVLNTGEDAIIVSDPEKFVTFDKLILPGVGSANLAMKYLNNSGISEAINYSVIDRGTPFMGICLGMQVIVDTLTENGFSQGFGWIPGEIKKLNDSEYEKYPVPHMGWNQVWGASKGLMKNLQPGVEFYFSHSYALYETDNNYVSGYTDHGKKFVSAIEKRNIFAVQFHPEKSQQSGMRLFELFALWKP